jgi:RNA polymerase sigma-70 factor (ECF subfamily)
MNQKGQRHNSKTTQKILLEHIFNQLHAPLFFYALKFTDNKEVAKDIVQDAFLSTINGNDEIQDLKAYLYQSVRNNCLNFLKHREVKSKYFQKEQERTKREIEFYDTHQTYIEKELHQILSRAIDELPEHYKIPFQLSRFEELKNKEIAKKLKLPLRTVETRIYRALIMLRKKLTGKTLTLFSFFYSK